MNLKRFIINNKKILSVFFTVVFSAFVVATLVYGATTIGSNITTGGNVFATGTVVVTGATTFYATSTWSGVGADLIVEGVSTSTFAGNFTVDGSVGLGSFASSTQALTNNSIDFGAYGGAWKDLYASGTAYLGGILLDGQLRATSTVMFTEAATTSHIYPWAANTYDLGTADTAWKSLYASGTSYLDSVLFSNAATTSHVYPLSNNTYDLGFFDAAWKDLYASGTAFLGSATTTQITPWANNTYDLGNQDYSWKNVYASGTILLGSTTLFGTTTWSGAETDLIVEGTSTSTFAGDLQIAQSSVTTTLSIGTPGTGFGGCIVLKTASSTNDTNGYLYLVAQVSDGNGELMLATSTNPADCY